MRMLVLFHLFLKFSRNTFLPNFVNFFSQEGKLYGHTTLGIGKYVFYLNSLVGFCWFSVSRLIYGCLQLFPKIKWKKLNFSKSKHCISKNQRENLDIMLIYAFPRFHGHSTFPLGWKNSNVQKFREFPENKEIHKKCSEVILTPHKDPSMSYL